jgi:pyrroline-5-carboxylate reductase
MPTLRHNLGVCNVFIHEYTNRKRKLLFLYLRIFGTAPVIDEKLMDAATVLAASGTAFAFLCYIRASMQAELK